MRELSGASNKPPRSGQSGRSPRTNVEFPAVRSGPPLETLLLRKGLGERAAARPQCSGCRRTPLEGERLHVYEDGTVRCELCRGRRSEEPVRVELVRGPEFGHGVRLRAA